MTDADRIAALEELALVMAARLDAQARLNEALTNRLVEVAEASTTSMALVNRIAETVLAAATPAPSAPAPANDGGQSVH